MNSERKPIWQLGSRDMIKGAFVAAYTSIVTTLIMLLQNNGLSLTRADLETILTTAIVATLGYLLKNLTSDEDDKVLGNF